jgi:hypothetical protein
MKTVVLAAGFTAAINSSMIWGGNLLSIFQGASEPVGLVVWGVALFAIAASLKRKNPPAPQAQSVASTQTVLPVSTQFHTLASDTRP